MRVPAYLWFGYPSRIRHIACPLACRHDQPNHFDVIANLSLQWLLWFLQVVSFQRMLLLLLPLLPTLLMFITSLNAFTTTSTTATICSPHNDVLIKAIVTPAAPGGFWGTGLFSFDPSVPAFYICMVGQTSHRNMRIVKTCQRIRFPFGWPSVEFA